ncbi:hypothetical protein MP638_000063 [Amoeboaphelidium occidentale]|nr:hypothetical protein MP638_000063 [Amoeboaphelidium occidentale]
MFWSSRAWLLAFLLVFGFLYIITLKYAVYESGSVKYYSKVVEEHEEEKVETVGLNDCPSCMENMEHLTLSEVTQRNISLGLIKDEVLQGGLGKESSWNKVLRMFSTTTAFSTENIRSSLRYIKKHLQSHCFNRKLDSISSKLCLPLSGTASKPWIVLGTAGTGTRIAIDNIGVGDVVKVSKLNNKQRDSKVFIEWMKEHDAVINLRNTSKQQETFLGWLVSRHLQTQKDTPVDYDINDVPERIRDQLRESMVNVDLLLQLEAFVTSGFKSVKDYGFKEPQASFFLPFIDEYYQNSNLNGKVKIVHVVRDAKDIAFSNQHLQKYQVFYNQFLEPMFYTPDTVPLRVLLYDAVELAFSESSPWKPLHEREYYYKMCSSLNDTNLSGIGVLDDDWTRGIRVIRFWMLMNEYIRNYSTSHAETISYIPIKLEDLCMHTNADQIVESIISEADIKDTEEKETWRFQLLEFVNQVDTERCNLRKYERGKDGVLIHLLQLISYNGLKTFDYSITNNEEVEPLIEKYKNRTTYFQRMHCLESGFAPIIELLHTGGSEPKIKNILLTVATSTYKGVMDNWLAFLEEALLNSSYEEPFYVLILTTDNDIFQSLQQKTSLSLDVKIIPFLIDLADERFLDCLSTSELGKYDLWKVRLAALRKLLTHGYNVFLADLDALFLKHPFEEFETNDALKGFDVIASRGRFPYELRDVLTWQVCMGAIYFRGTKFSLNLIQKMMEMQVSHKDDQRAINYAIYKEMTIFGESSWSNLTIDGLVSDMLISQKVAVLPFSVIPRFCKDDYRNVTSVSKPPEDPYWFTSLYPDAIALHCLTTKIGEQKENWWKRWHLWKADAIEAP